MVDAVLVGYGATTGRGEGPEVISERRSEYAEDSLQRGFRRFAAAARDAIRSSQNGSGLDRARALRMRAKLELAPTPAHSLRTLQEARGIEGALSTPEDRRAQLVGELLARCVALQTVDIRDVDATLQSNLTVAGSAVERQLLFPWLLAVGQTSRARRWLASERSFAQAEGLDARVRQAELLEVKLALATGDRERCAATTLQPTPELAGTSGGWRSLQAHYYWHVMDRDLAAAARLAEAMAIVEPTVPLVLRGRASAAHALVTALEGTAEIELMPPQGELTLFSTGPLVAAAEAVALGGTRQSALAWDAWFTECWPAHVLRASTWPTLVPRVRALLACRAGDTRSAIRLMEQAINLADRLDSAVEAAVARVQYAELLSLEPRSDSRARWSEVARAGRERCRALSLPLEHHAHIARTAATLGRFDVVCRGVSDPTAGNGQALTQREVEVLRLFSAGHSYRQSGALLNVGWRTVQSHAYNAYQKLGVSSKIAAITAATERGLL